MHDKIGIAFVVLFVFMNPTGYSIKPTNDPNITFNYNEGQESHSYTQTHPNWLFVNRFIGALHRCKTEVNNHPNDNNNFQGDCEKIRQIAVAMNHIYGDLLRRLEYLQNNCKETDRGRWSDPELPDSDKCKTMAFEFRKFLPNCTWATELECFQNPVAMYKDFYETNSGLKDDCYGTMDENDKFEAFSPTSCFRYAVLSLNKWHVLMAYKIDPCDEYALQKYQGFPTKNGKLIEKVCDPSNVMPEDQANPEYCKFETGTTLSESDAEIKKIRDYMDEHSSILRGFDDDGNIIINGGFTQGGHFPVLFKRPFVNLDLLLCQEAGSICNVTTWNNTLNVFRLNFTDSGAVCLIPPLTVNRHGEKLKKNRCVKGSWKMSNGFGEKFLNVVLKSQKENPCRMTLTIKSDGIEKCYMSWNNIGNFDARHYTGKATFTHSVTIGTAITTQTSQSDSHTVNDGNVVGSHEDTETQKKMTTFSKNLTKVTDQWNAKWYLEGKGTAQLSKNISAEAKTGGELAYQKMIEKGQDTSVQLENGETQQRGTSRSESNSVSDSITAQVTNAVTSTESKTVTIAMDCPAGEITHLDQLQITCGNPPNMVHKSPYNRAYIGDSWDPSRAVGIREEIEDHASNVKVTWLVHFVAFIALAGLH